MITGIVTSSLEATVRLHILDGNGRSQSIDAIIDTGFAGFMSLPIATVAALVCLCLTPSLVIAQENPQPLYADLVIVNAKIWTVNKKQPEAEALAILKGRLVFVGKSANAGLYVGAKTPVLDLKGKRVVPGF